MIKRDKSSLALALAEQRQLNERLGGESALAQIESLKKEKELLAQEVKSLSQELLKEQLGRVASELTEPLPNSEVNIEDETVTADSIGSEQDTYLFPDLNGKRVAFVGRLQSLLPHYRR